MARSSPLRRPPWMVGNDVVDLGDPRCAGKHEDQRFLARVFAHEEREAIVRSPDPARTLWLRWAAKEAAYKVVSKVRGSPPPFTHADYVVSEARRTVLHRGARIPFRVVTDQDPLHVVAVDPELERWPGPGTAELAVGVAPAPAPDAAGNPEWLALLRERFSDRERTAVHTPASARVRLEARAHLARVLGIDEGRLEIVCRGEQVGRRPPLALVDGKRAPADVSLSHHGRWVGWALLWWGPEPEAQPPPPLRRRWDGSS